MSKVNLCLLFGSCYLIFGTSIAYPMISKITYQFMVKWPLSIEDFSNAYTTSEFQDCKYHRKSLLVFNETENISFYLALGSYWYGYFMSIETAGRQDDISENIYLEYAFVVAQDQMFYLATSHKFDFMATELNYGNFRTYEKELFHDGVTVAHCMISVHAEANISPISADYVLLSTKLPSISSIIRTDGCKLWQNGAKREDVLEYIYSGKIPSLNVEKSLEILKKRTHLETLGVSELGVLSLDYLKRHLTIDNVVEILEFSSEHGLDGLNSECMQFIAKTFGLDE